MKKYYVLMAKSNPDSTETWLPLWMHLRDTAGIMRKLVSKWISPSIILASGMKRVHFMKVAVFLAAVHDIGKATSRFQSVITQNCPEKLHDILCCGFSVCQEYRMPGATPHAHGGQWILQSDTNDFGVPEYLTAVVGAHHGRPMSMDYLEESDLIKLYPVNFFGVEKEGDAREQWKTSWKDILNQAETLAGITSAGELPNLTLEAQVLLSGLLITADWIASNTDYFPLISLNSYGEESLYPARIETGWNKAAFPEGWHSDINIMEEELFCGRFGFLPNDVQKCVFCEVNGSETPGIFILEAQMGIGKTEAALGAAEVLACRKGEGGIFFGLPTQATGNGLFPRLYDWGVKVSPDTLNSVRLAHGSAELNEEYSCLITNSISFVEEDGREEDGMEVHPWFQGSKRALLADFVIGTVDQFLMASLRRKHFMLRHIGLAGKVVVIDECHAYDAYMNAYLDRSLEWMAAYGVPVILLSATLPAKRRKALVDCYVKAYSKYCLGKRKPEITYLREGWQNSSGYPLLTWTDGECVDQVEIQQTVKDKVIEISSVGCISDMTATLEEYLQEGGCACIIVNTVKYAQRVYEECRTTMKNVDIILYHAQYVLPDRADKERELLGRMGKGSTNKDRHRLVLIGTQVLEQSLDYDADIMVTQLCPVDLLLQRMGRLHRHVRDGREPGRSRPVALQVPRCIILEEGEEVWDCGTKAVYGEYLLMRTEKILPDRIKLPGDIPGLVQKVYDFEDTLGLEGEAFVAANAQYEAAQKKKKEEAGRYMLKKPARKNASTSQSIADALDNGEDSSEKYAEASVRDGVSSIDVLLMKREEGSDSAIVPVGKVLEKGIKLAGERIPEGDQGRMVSMQRLRLPHIFSSEWNRREVIRELEERNKKELSQWQLSPWLRGELILLLDQDGRTQLRDYILSYSFEKGLEYVRKEGENAEQGI